MTPLSPQILLVDDEEGVLGFAKIALERSGYRVLTARNGRNSLDIFAEHALEIDLVILDLNMPEMSGEDVLLEMQRIQPAVRVVLSTGGGDDEASRRLQGRGIAGLLFKPYTVRTLAEKVRSVLEAGTQSLHAGPPGKS